MRLEEVKADEEDDDQVEYREARVTTGRNVRVEKKEGGHKGSRKNVDHWFC